MGAITLFPSASRTSSANSSDVEVDAVGGALIIDISSVSGTSPTLDVKMTRKDSISGNYVDVPGAAFSQLSSTGTTLLTVYPGIGETANEGVSDSLGGTVRAEATIGGTSPDFTFSLSLEELR